MNIIVLVDRFGFPNGNASSIRVGLLGRALIEQGVSVKVLITKWSDYPDQVVNKRVIGRYEGVDFEYTYGKTVRDSSFFVRRYYTFRGWLLAMLRILIAPKSSCLYLYSDTPILCIPATFIAKFKRIPVVVELCEWRPATPVCSRLVRWYYKKLRFTLADGIVAISSYLQQRAESIVGDNAKKKIFNLPILADLNDYAYNVFGAANDEKYILWCGQIDAYLQSLLCLIRSFAHIAVKFPDCSFKIIGHYTETLKRDIFNLVELLGINRGQIILTGYVSRKELIELQSNATALLAPLEDDERSKARFPTKLGEYLASGRPVVTNSVGEINRFLKDGETAFIALPGDEEAFARKVEQAISNPELANRVGLTGRQVAEQSFHYSKHGRRFVAFLKTLSGQTEQAAKSSTHMKNSAMHACFVAPMAYPVLSNSNHDYVGGAEVQQLLIAKGLLKHGYLVTFIVGDFGQEEREMHHGIEVIKCPFRYLGGSNVYFFADTLKLILLMRKIGADFNLLRVPLGLLFAMGLHRRLFGGRLIKLIASDKDCFKYDSRFISKLYYPWGTKALDYTIFQSEYQKELGLKSLCLKGKVIRNPAHIIEIDGKCLEKDIDVLWVGRGTEVKQPEIFLNLVEQLKDVSFTMIMVKGLDSDKHIQSRVENRAKVLINLNYEGYVPYQRVTDFFRRAKILVCTSRLEGFPNTFLQAWQVAIPVVSLTVDPDNIIKNNRLGLVSGSFNKMKEDIKLLLAEERLRNELGENGKVYVQDNHTTEVIIRQFISLFESFKT